MNNMKLIILSVLLWIGYSSSSKAQQLVFHQGEEEYLEIIYKAIQYAKNGKVVAVLYENREEDIDSNYLQVYFQEKGSWEKRGAAILLPQAPTEKYHLALSHSGERIVLFAHYDYNHQSSYIEQNQDKGQYLYTYDWTGKEWKNYPRRSHPFLINTMSLSASGQVLALSNIYLSHYKKEETSIVQTYQWEREKEQSYWRSIGRMIEGSLDQLDYGNALELSADGQYIVLNRVPKIDSAKQNITARVWKWQENKHWTSRGQWLPRGDWMQLDASILGHSDQQVAFSYDGQTVALTGSNPTTYQTAIQIFTWKEGAWQAKGAVINAPKGYRKFAQQIELAANGQVLVVSSEKEYESPSILHWYYWEGESWVLKDSFSQKGWIEPLPYHSNTQWPLFQTTLDGLTIVTWQAQHHLKKRNHLLQHLLKEFHLSSTPVDFTHCDYKYLRICQSYQGISGNWYDQAGMYPDSAGNQVVFLELENATINSQITALPDILVSHEASTAANLTWVNVQTGEQYFGNSMEIILDINAKEEGEENRGEHHYLRPEQAGTYMLLIEKGGCKVWSEAYYCRGKGE